MEKAEHLDRIDMKILAELQKSSRISMASLGEKVGLSKSPVLSRVRRLEQEGFIKGYTAQLDMSKLGLAQISYVQIRLDVTTTEALDAFNAAVQEHPEIEECHMIAGGFDYLLKIRTKDMSSYRRALSETIARLPHVAQTTTFMAMEIVKES
ncbi:transcriptional regulator AsnC-type-like protein [Actibacterium atlanticum]|uniref:Transcriptional regulator AsnC-type-like protein n=1 Tax=Actibacterium atlanticum TaxID=1461693 RepID=A0A058ZN58_9RHOB|nr:Lrp/AsnC ligand binding domain-containing protein [Actibacterium atlanticum]KCV82622.1 transcriptional regulator AsnC-type-like protein [Actibacterium atlanticum]